LFIASVVAILLWVLRGGNCLAQVGLTLLLLAGTAGIAIDVKNRRFGVASRLFLGLWCLSLLVAFILFAMMGS